MLLYYVLTRIVQITWQPRKLEEAGLLVCLTEQKLEAFTE